MGEAVELVSCCAWGNESLVLEAENVLGDQAVTVASLNGFTPEQLAERAEWNGKCGGFDRRPAPSAAAMVSRRSASNALRRPRAEACA